MASTTFEKPLDNDVSAISTNLGSPSSASAVTGADAFSKINSLNSNLSPLIKSLYNVNQSATSSRGTVTGQFLYNAKECTVNLIFTSSVTLSNSPGIIGLSTYKPKNDSALSCIDITSGISSAITGQVPCGIATSGTVYVKEIVENHVYAITGTYIRNN